MSNVLKVNTVLICKNSMLREGLKHILSGTRFSLQPEDPIDKEPDSVPGLVIVDANFHPVGMDNEIRSLKEQHASARVVVLADHFNLEGMISSLRAGADGYCLTTIGCEALIRYLDLAMLGEIVFPSAFVLAAMSSLQGAGEGSRRLHIEARETLQIAQAADAKNSPVRTLSSREAEILQCLVQGSPNKVIARKLDVAEATVKVHIKAILRKIRVANRTQAAMWAVNHLSASQPEHAWLPLSDGLPLHYPTS